MIDIVGIFKPVRVQLVSLGCPKNRVDSEKLLYLLSKGGIEIVSGEYEYSESRPDVVVINTCGFIASAKEESIDEILIAVEAKREKYVGKVVVCGCLSERYRGELKEQIPEVDAFFGTYEWERVANYITGKSESGYSADAEEQPKDSTFTHSHFNERIQTEASHYAYLKISEGCNRKCSYCAIPLIKGEYKSVPIELLVQEAQTLAAKGVRELILIAQDTTYYGLDLYKKRMLGKLIEELSRIEGVEWIRIHYSYPLAFPADVITQMRRNPKVCKYIDIPLQHCSTQVLRMMRRGVDMNKTEKIIATLRNKVPGVAIRTTLMVGHPGEGKEEFSQLLDFVKRVRFEHLGVFTYSEEENTYDALHYKDEVSQRTKDARYRQVMLAQSKIVEQIHSGRIGATEKVIVDRVDENYIYTRSQFESPEVDGVILIPIKLPKGVTEPPLVLKNLIGTFVSVRICGVSGYDYIAEFA